MKKLDVKLLPAQLEFIRRENEDELALCAGLASGKSKVGALWAVKQALEQHRNCIVAAQSFTSTNDVIMNEIRFWLNTFGAPYEENKSKQLITLQDGTWIRGGSSQAPNALTGLTDAENFLTDESAIFKQDSKQFLADRCRGLKNGKLIIPRYRYIGTAPLAGHTLWFAEFIKKNPKKVIFARTEEGVGKIISKEYYEQRLKDYGGINSPIARAQLFAEILENANDFCVFRAMGEAKEIPVTAGIDMSGNGRDMTSIFITNGLEKLCYKEYQQINTLELANVLRQLIATYGIRRLNFDNTGGWAQGIIDVMRLEKNVEVNGINFGQSAVNKDRYSNARAEMYVEGSKHWIWEDFEQERQVTSFITNASGKVQLIPKDDIKKIIGHSPDGLDAAMLALYTMENVNEEQIDQEQLSLALSLWET